MPKGGKDMSIITNEFEAVLEEYLFKQSGDQWVASFGPTIKLVVKVDEANKTVILLNELYQLTELIKHPRSKDFEKRFSNRLNRMKNKINKLIRLEKKAKHAEGARIVLGTHYANPDAEPSFGNLRNYHPMMYCDSCHQMVRENLMKTEHQCLGCAGGK
jgi:hypothetical protein